MRSLIAEVEAQRNLMIAVSTAQMRIQDANDEYVRRRRAIAAALSKLGIQDPNMYSDLWHWYGKWSSGDLPTYQSRRGYVRELYAPLIERLDQERQETIRTAGPLREPSGWVRVDRALDKARVSLESARNEEDFQTVGLLCREALISLGQAVYKVGDYSPLDGFEPSETDANRMLEAYIETKLAGGPNEAVRRHAKASLRLSNDLVHRRTAQFRDAAMCAEATTSVVNLMAIVSGRRDPSAE